MIAHILYKNQYEIAKENGVYSHDSLATEGFIHCCLINQIVDVANAFYRDEKNVWVMLLDETKLDAEVKFEDLMDNGALFPHVYGNINMSACVNRFYIPKDKHGMFRLPNKIRPYTERYDEEIVFGNKEANVVYHERRGVYGLIKNDDEYGIVSVDGKDFLIGGGLKRDESEEACLKRECLEEIGFTTKIHNHIGTFCEYKYSSKDDRYYRLVASIYYISLDQQILESVEEDHEFKWVKGSQGFSLDYQKHVIDMLGSHVEEIKPLTDADFDQGDLCHLVVGNSCRYLDGRRTTGSIGEVDLSQGMFKWNIESYEDAGSYWWLPFEDISKFQFYKNASKTAVSKIKAVVRKYNKKLNLDISEETTFHTNQLIEVIEDKVELWLRNEIGNELITPELCQNLLEAYMTKESLIEHEHRTSKMFVLNPNSGEWIKGLQIVLAELGLSSYQGTIPRTKDIFSGVGSKEERTRYIYHRLAFVRALYRLMEKDEVVLYRGMSSEHTWASRPRSFISMTFKQEVAERFMSIEEEQYRIAYMLKATIPANKLFMTYLETKAMNNNYFEYEGLILYNDEFKI